MIRQTVLKALLRERHIQEHRTFCREYDKVARTIDIGLVGTYPSKATFYRWLSGDIRGLPHPSPCRVLEKLLPGWSAAELFEQWTGIAPPNPRSATPLPNASLNDVVAIYTTRAEFIHEHPPHTLLDNATEIRAAGLSLNMLCQQYPDQNLLTLLERGGAIECLFLDPEGESIRSREREEGHSDGTLARLTKINIGTMERLRERLTPAAQERMRIRTYEDTIRFNITLIDGETGIVQAYLPAMRGVDNPTFVTRRHPVHRGLYDVFRDVYESLWEKGKRL
jgi:hypothetical protein